MDSLSWLKPRVLGPRLLIIEVLLRTKAKFGSGPEQAKPPSKEHVAEIKPDLRAPL